MKKSTILRFINKAIGSHKKEMFVLVSFRSHRSMRNFDGNVSILTKKGHRWDKLGCIMLLNRSAFATNNNLSRQKAIILHELGHYFTRSCQDSKREYRAQQWAVHKAKEMGLHGVVYTLKDNIKDWVNYDWNSSNRKYRMAYNIAKNEKLI